MTPSVEQLELAATATFSPAETTMIGGWRVARTGGFTRRLNSATAVGIAETSFDTKAAVRAWLAEHGAPLVVRVTPLTDPGTAESCERNWYLEKRDGTVVMVTSIERRTVPHRVAVIDPRDAGFRHDLATLDGRRQAVDANWAGIVDRALPDAAGVWIGGVAVAYVAVNGTIAYVYSLAVHPGQRRGGIATQMMETAHSWAVERGAHVMALQVLGTNTAARGLYEHLGYTEAYRYHYLEAVVHR